MKNICKKVLVGILIAFTLCMGVVYASSFDFTIELNGEIHVNYPKAWWIKPTAGGSDAITSGVLSSQYITTTNINNLTAKGPGVVSTWVDSTFRVTIHMEALNGSNQNWAISFPFQNTTDYTWYTGATGSIGYYMDNFFPTLTPGPALPLASNPTNVIAYYNAIDAYQGITVPPNPTTAVFGGGINAPSLSPTTIGPGESGTLNITFGNGKLADGAARKIALVRVPISYHVGGESHFIDHSDCGMIVFYLELVFVLYDSKDIVPPDIR
ncbi:MAG: hypothetical protein FWE62_02880 [Firmicutes bacterium]|nr:hypothetical protein [Bacillota bacterium]